MNYKNRFQNRYSLIIIILSIMMSILMIKLAILTLVEGDEHRQTADNKRARNIPITAARGDIRDRNGKLLAGSRPSFAVQLIKDQFDAIAEDDRNENLLRLTKLLEEDGASYINDYPIELNVYKYRESGAVESEKPLDKVIRIIRENNLLPVLLTKNYDYIEPSINYDFKIGNRILQYLRDRGHDLPIVISESEGQYSYGFVEGLDIDQWKAENNIGRGLGAFESIVELANRDKGAIRALLSHSLTRKIVFEELLNRQLEENLIMEEYVLSYDDNFYDKKRELMASYDFITMETSAEEDFINIFMEESIDNFLYSVIVREGPRSKDIKFIPGEILLKMVKDKEKIPVKLVEEDGEVRYESTSKDELGKFPYEILVDTANKYGLMEEFLKSDQVRPYAQSQLLRDGVNTRISIADGYEYIYINEKKDFYNFKSKKNAIDLSLGPKEAFEIMRERHKIPSSISKYEARSILSFQKALKEQSYRGYNPVNIAYGIQNETVAKIEEGMSDVPGVQVSIEPVRYYPEGETAAHIIGQLGRISQQNEIDKYIKEKGYFPNDIIGKTGIEESFEDVLKGTNGFKKVEVDAFGNTIKIIEEKKPIPGNNIYLSIDLDLQKKAEESMKKTLDAIQKGGTYVSEFGNYQMAGSRGRAYKNAKSGATVAVNSKTGEVIALVSEPSFDPNLFSTGISSADWAELMPEHEEDLLAPRPLYNIATQSAVQPGSTFKPLTALAGLDKGLSPYKPIRDMGYVEIGGHKYRCHIWKNGRGTHGNEDVFGALKDSCNYYFYTLMLGKNYRTGEYLGVKVDIDDIINLTSQMGMNDKTGIEINIPSETYGRAPNPAKKTSGIKNLLRYYLNANLKLYVRDDKALKDGELEEIIEEIVGWVNQGSSLSRAEVSRRLDGLGINGELRLKGKDPLTDVIKYTHINQASWNIGDDLNISIGQGEAEYTPIQMANFIATLSNGGYHNKLTLIDNIKNYNNSKTLVDRQPESKRIELNNYENLEYVKKGMLMVSKSGTSRRAFGHFPVNIGSKTGTAQKAGKNPATGELYDDFAWFVAFGPYEDPEIAVASVIFQGGTGGNASAMTRDIIGEYLGLNQKEQRDSSPFRNELVK